jgi:MscS family membrane protein
MTKRISIIFLLLCISPFSINTSYAGETKALHSIDTKSPRDTLNSFIDSIVEAYQTSISIQNSYMKSDRLYLTSEEEKKLDAQKIQISNAKRTLNLSETSDALAQKVALDKVLELAEILARIDIPPNDEIPDEKEMAKVEFKNWTIPGTEITLVRVDKGTRAGEYLFSTETVENLSTFYQRVKHESYKTAAIAGIYNSYHYGTNGLRAVIPYRWTLNLPDALTYILMDQPIWRWIGIFIVFFFTIATIAYIHGITKRWRDKKTGDEYKIRKHWTKLVWPTCLLIFIPFVIGILEHNLRVSELMFATFTILLWTIFTLSGAWVVWSGGNLIAEAIVQSRQLFSGSIDSQLIRLALRLTSFLFAIGILIVGAQRLGIPAYSILTGLGVGGITIAFAAKDSVANLIGSLVIMFEKPFRVGHWIKAGDAEGVIESVGFRSTRIRTFHNSVLSVPSDMLANTIVDNMGMRQFRRTRNIFYIKFNTSPQKIENFIAEIKNIVNNGKFTSSENIQIAFKGFASHGLEILVNFFLEVPDLATELIERQKIMMSILKLAEQMEIEFAQPLNPTASV